MLTRTMFARIVSLLIIVFFHYAYTASATDDVNGGNNTEECRRKVTGCTSDLSTSIPVCGSDGITYPNECKLLSQQCQGIPITIKHTGPCAESKPCIQARQRTVSRPVCRPDGTYAPLQCNLKSGYCWCATPQGRAIPGTVLRGEKPNCGEDNTDSRGAETRSSKQGRKSPNWKQRRQYSNRHRNTCDRADKARFNGNLIENFKIEYRRMNSTADVIGDKNVERVLGWKFESLDIDKDGYLDRAEYKELRRLAKKVVRPKKCARTFARTCDLNHDLKLSRQEWGACLSNDFSLLKGNHPAPVHSRPTFNDDPPESSDDTDANDCISDRRLTLEDQRQDSRKNFYIPECTPDGRYHKVQCYSGYCWCVYQDSGKPIPGTPSKNETPNCNPVPTPVRPMKGCPEAKKQLFLRDLMDLMQKKMKASSTDSDEVTDNWQASKEERVATWHFVMLDKNKNKVLERKEWKSFRAMVANIRQLRRCGKKLPRYCDVNNDRRISMTEWLSCLNAQRPVSGDTSTEKVSTLKPRRTGINPLEAFLNDDD